jgi:transposase
MTKAVEVITSVERRRRWSLAEKERIVAAAMEPAQSPPRSPVRPGFTPANYSAGANSSVSGRKFQLPSIR